MTAQLLARSAATLAVTAGLGLAGSMAVDAAAPPTASPVSKPTPMPNVVTLATLKERCNVAVQRRLATLGTDDSFVKQSAALISGDRVTLEAQISADAQGLTALDKTIQGDTTRQQAFADCQRIVTGFHVYVLEDPKIHEVIAADGVTKVDATFQTLIPELQTLINNSSVSPAVKAQAQAALNDLTSKVTAAQTSISGVTSSVIALVPSGWPGNQVVLKSAAANIKTAHVDLDGARADVNHVIALLGS